MLEGTSKNVLTWTIGSNLKNLELLYRNHFFKNEDLYYLNLPEKGRNCLLTKDVEMQRTTVYVQGHGSPLALELFRCPENGGHYVLFSSCYVSGCLLSSC